MYDLLCKVNGNATVSVTIFKGVFMKKINIVLAMLAMALVLSLALVSCDDGGVNGGGGGSGGLGLYQRSSYAYVRVALSANSPSLSSRDFAVTIDGSSITLGGSEQNHGSNPYIQLNFTSPRLTVGTRYAVTVVYNGSAITPFTRSATLTCQAD
jgi:hypothetical protein